MRKRYAAAIVAALAMAGSVQAQTADQKVRSVETWGSVQGDYSGVSLKEVSYYGANGQPVSVVKYGAYYDGTMEPTEYTYYDYDDAGRIIKETLLQYKVGSGNRMEWKDKGSKDYKYDEAGNLVSVRDYFYGDSTVYEYDGEGNKTATVKYLPGSQGGGTELSREIYSDFVAPNCPQSLVSTGSESYYRYSAKMSYDDAGNMTEKLTYNGETRLLTQKETWTYKDGQLSLYERFKVSGSEDNYTYTPDHMTVYTVEGTSPLRIHQSDSTYFAGEWSTSSLPTVTEYFTPQPASAPELKVSIDPEKANNVVLTFNATGIEGAANVAYDIFRHGIKVARVSAADAEDGMITYTDANVPNGTYDYMVQAVDTDVPDIIGDGKVETNPLNSYGHGMNCSARERVSLDTKLPAPSRLRATKVEYVSGECFVTLAWDEPADKDNYSFESYNVYMDGMKLPENAEASMAGPVVKPITENSFRISLGYGNASSEISGNYYVEAVYGIGLAQSEVATITNKSYSMAGLVEKTEERWGDALGEVSKNRITNKIVSYYDGENRLSAKVSYGANTATGKYEPVYYEGTLFSADSLSSKTFHQQYGLYDGADFKFIEANDTTYCTYDKAGHLLTERSLQSTDSIVYTYDEEGNKISYERYVPDTWGSHGGKPYVMEGYNYSDFVAPDCPQTIQGFGAYSSYKNSYKVKYDSDNNIIEKETYNEGGTLIQVERWTYELGVLVLYETNKVKSATGEDGTTTYTETPSKKTVYTVVGDKPLRIKHEDYTYTYGEWGTVPYYYVTEYGKPDAATAPVLAMEPVADKLNTVKLTFDATAIPDVSNVAYDVYRHGIKLARLSASDAKDGMLTYVDESVFNGEYDYFVQPVDVDADKTGEEALNSYGFGMNVSNTVREVFATELPVPTNVRATSVEYSQDSCYVTVEWDEPADKDLYQLRYYNVFDIDQKSPVNSTSNASGLIVQPITENKYRLYLGQGTSASNMSMDIYVQAVYALGKVNTDTVTIRNQIEDGIADVEAGNCIRFSHGVLAAGEGVTFDVYTADGKVVATGCEGTLSLGNRPAGVYVVRSHSNGRTSTQKVVLRGNN